MRRCEFCDSPVPSDATVCPVCRQKIAEESLERILPMLKRPETPKVMALSVPQRLWGIVRNPATTYREIARSPDNTGPVLVIVMNALIMAAIYLVICSKITVRYEFNATMVTGNLLESPYSGTVMVGAVMSILPNVLMGMVYLIVGSAFAHIAFKITGGTGKRGKTISIIGYSMVPVLLVRLLAVLVVLTAIPVFSLEGLGTAAIVTEIYNSYAWVILDWLTVAAFFWVGFVLVFGIREAHDTSTLWAFLVAAACMAVLIWTFWQAH